MSKIYNKIICLILQKPFSEDIEAFSSFQEVLEYLKEYDVVDVIKEPPVITCVCKDEEFNLPLASFCTDKIVTNDEIQNGIKQIEKIIESSKEKVKNKCVFSGDCLFFDKDRGNLLIQYIESIKYRWKNYEEFMANFRK